MSNASDKNNPLDLSALDFGPAWARDKKEKKSYQKYERSEERGPKGKKKFTERRKFNKGDRPQRPQRRERAPLPEGIKASIMPVESGIDNLAKQVVDTGRTYSVFDLARIILKSRDRYNVGFSVANDSALSFFQSKADGAAFLTQEEALAHFAASEAFAKLYKTVEVEVDAPSGNFPTIACCGFNGEAIAPPNFHGYQAIVAARHAADFSNMSLENYKRRIQTERDEEKVAAWLESMKKQTRYQLVSDETVELESKAAALEHFANNGFKEQYLELKRVFVKSDISFTSLSPGLASGLLEVIADQNKYPGELSSFLCRQLSGRHLAVYKWQGKLHAGPSRPHVVPQETALADRPAAILKWVEASSGKGVDALWKSVLPEKVSDEEKAGWYHDLHWMLNQGYLVLLEDGKLHLSSDSKLKANSAKKKSAKKAKPNPQDQQSKGANKSETKQVAEKGKDAEETQVKPAPEAEDKPEA